VRFSLIAFIVLAIGGAVEIIPLTFIKSNVPTIASVKPYTPLELAGRDIYIREGCYTCHSQMVRPFRWETDRYGEYSKIGEFVYDHPFQWGSRRTGPDLARAGVTGGPYYKNAAWHYSHFMDPQKMNAQTIMPKYSWFISKDIDINVIPAKIRAMKTLGVPYPDGYDKLAVDDLKKQAAQIADELKASGITVDPGKQVIAVIAYLHKLGRDISAPALSNMANPAETVDANVVLPVSAAELANGKATFRRLCTPCHGPEGKGIAAFPNLTDNVWINGNSPSQVVKSITNGNPVKGMVPFSTQLSPEQIKQVASYVLNGLKK
jgi:cytochrome c oxidase cbb3-type subunit I/II